MYGKLFASMFDGSLAQRGPWEALVTFMPMLALADREGFLDMTPEALSRRTLIPLEIIQKGIAALELPDPESRDPAEDGRRLIRISEHRSWGWKIVNYEKYRKIRSAEERREYMREHQRARRERLAGGGNVPRGTSARGVALETYFERVNMEPHALETLIHAWMAWARKEHPAVDAERAFASFRDWGKANANRAVGKKIDWEAAWRNWVRKEPVPLQRGGPAPKPEKRTCDYCGNPRVGVVNGFNHCRMHAASAMDGDPPTVGAA